MRIIHITLLLLFCLPFYSSAQEGIDFVHGLSWQQVKEKAKRENRYIMVDCHATWCGPCRQMEQDIFPLPECGDFFNRHFINVKVQVDRTAKDDAETRAWYEDSKEIARAYDVRMLPTFLFFNPDGELVHKQPGATSRKEDFLQLGAIALDTNQQVYTLLRKAEQHRLAPAELRETAIYFLNLQDLEHAVLLSNDYMATLRPPYDADAIRFIAPFVQSSSSMGFALYQQDPSAVNAVLGPNVAEEKLHNILWREQFLPAIRQDGAPDWALLEKEALLRHPGLTAMIRRMAAEGKANYYLSHFDTTRYIQALVDYIDRFSSELSDWDRYGAAENLARRTDKKGLLKKALQWTRNDEGKEDADQLYIRAQVLYKLGRRKEALPLLHKALDIASSYRKPDLEKTLQQMEKGGPAW